MTLAARSCFSPRIGRSRALRILVPCMIVLVKTERLAAAGSALPEASLALRPGPGRPALAVGRVQEIAAVIVPAVGTDRVAIPTEPFEVLVGRHAAPDRVWPRWQGSGP